MKNIINKDIPAKEILEFRDKEVGISTIHHLI